MHTSGEFINSEMPMQNAGDVQKMGSQITYLKRYSLMAMLGVSTEDEDDDGNSATHKPQQKHAPRIDYKEKQNNVDKIKNELAKQTQGKTTEEKQKFLNEKLKVSSFRDVEKMSNDELINLYNKLSGTLLK
jgi:exonuclease VII large subunit